MADSQDDSFDNLPPGSMAFDTGGVPIDPNAPFPDWLNLQPNDPIPWWERIGVPSPQVPIQGSINDLLNGADQDLKSYGGYAGPSNGQSPDTSTVIIPGTPVKAPTPTPVVTTPTVPPTITVPNPAYNSTISSGTGFYQEQQPPYRIAQVAKEPSKQFITNPFGPGSVPNPWYNPNLPPPTITIPNPNYKAPAPTPAPAPVVSTSTTVTVNNIIGNGLEGALHDIAATILANAGEISQSIDRTGAVTAGIIGAGLSTVANELETVGANVAHMVSSAISSIGDHLSKMLDTLEQVFSALLRALWTELIDTLRSLGSFFWDEFEKRFMEDVVDPLGAK